MSVVLQATIKNSISCTGIGLHSGARIDMTLHPGEADSGILFVRRDRGGSEILARFDRVCDTTMGTTLRNDGVTVATVEHLCAALWGAGIDNIRIDLDGPEVPIMDGSAHPFLFLVECAGLERQRAPRRWVQVRRPVEVSDGDSRLSIYPADMFSIALEIDFANQVIAHQSLHFVEGDGLFKAEISRARTFGFFEDVERLRAAGLARGGSLDNAVVLHGNGVLNEDGLRYRDEFVRHKVLDCIGDLYLAGGPLLGHVEGLRPGHAINNRLMRALFADSRNWCYVERDEADLLRPAAAERAVAFA